MVEITVGQNEIILSNSYSYFRLYRMSDFLLYLLLFVKHPVAFCIFVFFLKKLSGNLLTTHIAYGALFWVYFETFLKNEFCST